MTEIVKIFLENEMDLILAQQRCMKLADFAGLSLSAQTSFGTAVSEVCRHVLNKSHTVTLVLGMHETKEVYALAAKIVHSKKGVSLKDEAMLFASRLADKVILSNTKMNAVVDLHENLSPRHKFSTEILDGWRNFFRNEVPLSPYEEVKQKNIQLKELTLKLEQSEQQYKTLAESLPLIIYTTNESGELVYVNKWLQQFAGQNLIDVKENNWTSLIHPEDISTIQQDQTDKGVQAGAKEYRVKNSDGEYIWHIGSTVPVYDEANIEQYRIGYLADIHAQKLVEQTLKDNDELKAAQRELARYQADLEERISELNHSNFELAQFAYVASHDLQEPLRKLMIYSDTLQTKFGNHVNTDVQFILSRMYESCKRMRLLILDLLNFSKIRKDEFVFAKIDLNIIVVRVLENLDRMILEKNAEITVEQLPVIETSARHMEQLFENLIVNSLKYAKKEVAPVIRIWAGNNGIGHCVIYIKDNGIGFENKYSDKIFGLFQRLHSRNEFEGTGIGLAICKKITDLHNGAISATSEVGKGSLFTVKLPETQEK